jgi:hypothetical protein
MDRHLSFVMLLWLIVITTMTLQNRANISGLTDWAEITTDNVHAVLEIERKRK